MMTPKTQTNTPGVRAPPAAPQAPIRGQAPRPRPPLIASGPATPVTQPGNQPRAPP